MQDLWVKFKNLKKKVSGNREKGGYEETFGMPREEQWRVTPVNKWNRRILAELEYALNLNEEKKGEFDAILNESLVLLDGFMEAEGVLTKTVCETAEKILLPMKPAAKEYSLILAAHAHIDMNWMWGWQETVAATLSTFRTMLNIMDEYPDFCYSQSQASVYKIVEDYDPELMERIKQRIKEGRWEITATAWVETDKNMPTTESLLRHIKYTRDYLEEKWGVDPASLEIDFSPDTFGHSANVPEINIYGDVKYYYQCRGIDGDALLFRWKGQSGREVLVHREQHWYNAAITTEIAPGLMEISRRSGGLKTGLLIYGVGDHGGGPTRRDVERATEMMGWEIYPNIKFGTLREYFKIAESVRDNLQVIDRELNYFAPGCYTTQSRIKLGNRKSEKSLLEAESISALAKIYAGSAFNYRSFENAWQNVLFTHFHDILTGSCVQDSREHAMGLFSHATAVANTQHANALRVFSENIDTSSIITDDDRDSQSEGAGVGYGLSNYTGVPSPERGRGLVRIFHVFNAQPYERTENVEIAVWDWVGDMSAVKVCDSAGGNVEFALLDHGLQQYWDHKYFRFIARVTVPALGYATLVLSEDKRDEYKHRFNLPRRADRAYSNYVLENENIRAEFDSKNGNLISLVDKESGDDMICREKPAALQFVNTERASSSAWQIGHYLKVIPIDNVVRIHPTGHGELRSGLYVEKKIAGSTIRETIYLEKGAKAVTYKWNIDWNETGMGDNVPVLVYNVPLAKKSEDFMFDIPAGAVTRKEAYIDVPGLQYGAAVNTDKDKKSLVISSDCKYGYRAYEGNLAATLINSSTSPDPYPERGIHNITMHVGFEYACPKLLEDFATNLNSRFSYVPNNSRKGSLPMDKELLSFKSETAVMTSASITKDGKSLLVRFYEACGKDCEVEISIDRAIKSASFVGLSETAKENLTVVGKTAKLTVGANHVGAAKIDF